MTDRSEISKNLRDAVREYDHFENMFNNTFVQDQANRVHLLTRAAAGGPETAEMMLSFIRRLQAVADALDVYNQAIWGMTLTSGPGAIRQIPEEDGPLTKRALEIIGATVLSKTILVSLASDGEKRSCRRFLSVAFSNEEIKELKALAAQDGDNRAYEDA